MVVAGQSATWTSGMLATTSFTWNVNGAMSNLPLPVALDARDAGVTYCIHRMFVLKERDCRISYRSYRIPDDYCCSSHVIFWS